MALASSTPSAAPRRRRAHLGACSALAVAVGEEPDTIEEVYEPYLIREGLLQRTPQGRILTSGGWKLTGLEPPPPKGGLFR